MTGTIKALKIIATKDIRSPKEFAKEMWPDSEGWQRVHNIGHGAHRGAGMYLAGDSFLGKLRNQGLIWGGYDDRIILTEKGKDVLRQADIPAIDK